MNTALIILSAIIVVAAIVFIIKLTKSKNNKYEAGSGNEGYEPKGKE